MKLTSESKLLLAIVGVTVAIIAGAAILFTKPAPTFTNADIVGKTPHVKGNPKAKVTLVEFGDFQCPACGAVKPYVDDTLKTYGSDIYFVFRNYPLSQHEFAQKAAEAAEEAGAQGKYWEMYDELYANQDKFSDGYFSTLGADLKLDDQKYADALNNNTHQQTIDADVTDGNRFGVNATPTFFLNGTKLDLTSYTDLKAAVAQALK